MSEADRFLDALTQECAEALYGDDARRLSADAFFAMRAKVERALRRALAAAAGAP